MGFIRKTLGLGVLVGSLLVGGCKTSVEDYNISTHAEYSVDLSKRSVAFILDDSGSMKNKVKHGKHAGKRKVDVAREVFENLLARYSMVPNVEDKVQAGLFYLGESSMEVPIMPFNYEALKRAGSDWKAHGGTPLTETIAYAQRELNRNATGIRYMVVLSDGESTNLVSPASLVREIERVHEVHKIPQTNLFFVGYNMGKGFDEAFSGFQGMENVAVYRADNGEELEKGFSEIAGKILAESPEGYDLHGREVGK